MPPFRFSVCMGLMVCTNTKTTLIARTDYAANVRRGIASNLTSSDNRSITSSMVPRFVFVRLAEVSD